MKGKSEQVLNTIASFNPHNRIGTPEEVADAIVFLSSEGSRWVTGQVRTYMPLAPAIPTNLRLQVLGVNGGMASV